MLIEADVEPVYRSVARTHRGHQRTANQDSLLELPADGLWVVADGMGGYSDGDVASRMVCSALAGFQAGAELEDSVDEVRQRMSEVNLHLYNASIRSVNPVQSGSTVVALLTRGARCAVLWAGDSRAYRLRQRELVQMSVDHTWSAHLHLLGIAADDAGHVITRAVGGEDTLLLDVRLDQVHRGDRYLLCSDGLNHELSFEQIGLLLAAGDLQHCSQALIDATLAAGARDNVTVVIVEAF